LQPILEARSSTQAALPPSTKDFSSKLYCPHDFSHQDETRDDLPTLLKRSTASGKLELPRDADIPKEDLPIAAPAMALFDKPAKRTPEEEQQWAHLRKESQTLRMPYKRYLAILPLMEQLKADQVARERSELSKRRLCPAAPAPEQNIKLEPIVIKDEDDAMYSVPLREQLKRKHQTNGKADADQQPTTSKRSRKDENTKPIVRPEMPVKTEPAVVVHQVPGESDDEVVEVPIQRQSTEPPKPPPAQSKKQQKRNQFQRGFKAKNRGNHPQSSSQQVAQPKAEGNFDYKNVDFRQFKGGAQRARGTEIKQNIRGKVSVNIFSLNQIRISFIFFTSNIDFAPCNP